MGCTHSKNSKSKATGKAKGGEQPLEHHHHSRVAHFDETQPITQSTSIESEEAPVNHYTRNLLNETKDSTQQKTTGHEKSAKRHEASTDHHVPIPTQHKPQSSELPPEKMDSVPHTAVPPPPQKQYVASTYYPMPTEKHKSPEKKKKENNNEKRKKEPKVLGPNYRPQLTPEDLEYIKRSVQQRNERRAYMMAHRDETDDTLYELEVRMPEKDYTNRIEVTQQQQNSRVY